MEKEYIERGALLEELQEEIEFESTMYTEEQNKWLRAGLSIAARDVRNQPTADVVPRDIIIELTAKLHSMLPHKSESSTYELGKEHTIYDILKCLDELEEKHTKGGEGDGGMDIV